VTTINAADRLSQIALVDLTSRRRVWPVIPRAAGDLSVREILLTFINERTRAMNGLTISTKGQITLRKDLLQHLGVHPGDRITFEKAPGGEVRIRATRPSGSIEGFFGALRREGQPAVSIENMNAAIEKGWAGEL
jgi:bifunctional DNA-binding transcriptional regulator/antitoxin component of YhaV-PrlF toxin-antitoxin module